MVLASRDSSAHRRWRRQNAPPPFALNQAHSISSRGSTRSAGNSDRPSPNGGRTCSERLRIRDKCRRPVRPRHHRATTHLDAISAHTSLGASRDAIPARDETPRASRDGPHASRRDGHRPTGFAERVNDRAPLRLDEVASRSQFLQKIK